MERFSRGMARPAIELNGSLMLLKTVSRFGLAVRR